MQTALKDRPLLMHGVEVRAVLEGRMSQFWRVLKPRPVGIDDIGPYVQVPVTDPSMPGFVFNDRKYIACPYGVGDRLWVKEAWRIDWTPSCGHGIWYAADQQFVCWDTPDRDGYQWLVEHYGNNNNTERLRPSVHMPRWASRLTLEVTGVRVERLRSVTGEEARASGYPGRSVTNGFAGAIEWFRNQWDELNPKHPYESNPWVRGVAFRRVTE